jgi:FkbM family methyltransferase
MHSSSNTKKRTILTVMRGVFHWLYIFIGRKKYRSIYIKEGGMIFKVPANSIFGWHLAKYRTYENNALKVLHSIFHGKSGGIFVDVGANFGWYSLLFGYFAGDYGKVVAVEPDLDNQKLLLENIEFNGCSNIELIACAVGKENKELMLKKAPSTNPGMHSLVALPHVNEFGEMVIVRRLDDLLSPYPGSIELMKIDIEGFEVEALLGAENVLKRCKFLMIEYSPSFIVASGNKKEDFFEILYKSSFDIFQISENGIFKLSEDRIIELIEKSFDSIYWQEDFLCVNRELIDQNSILNLHA